MIQGRPPVPVPVNEPVLSFAPGSPERAALKDALADLRGRRVDLPLWIGGKQVRTGKLGEIRPPHERSLLLGKHHMGGAKETRAAIDAALAAAPAWAETDFHTRASIFLRAAELLAGPWRARMNAAAMLIQSKNVFQAEIDIACELIDFWRFNVHFAEQIHAIQPISPKGFWNYTDYRPLEGFVFAVTPFNFASIAGNLPTAPAIMGNTVVWKPAESTAYVAHLLMELLREAGLPDGVINMVSGPPAEIGEAALTHPSLAGVHFTGSTPVFKGMWSTVGANMDKYRTFPRLVGETGGKDFIVAHPSADMSTVATAMVRGAFEYQGQKCSAASRAYVPQSMWPKLKERVGEDVSTIKMGSVEDFRNFVNAVIDDRAFKKIKGYLDRAKKAKDAKVLFGGGADDSEGYFIQPTIIEAKAPDFVTMREEIFGPVLTVYVYPDSKFSDTLELVDRTSPYGLTGAVFATDKAAVSQASSVLRQAAGNFYVNDKPTGAVVAQQPFGGARLSGTNDKAGSILNMLRWTSPRSIKETFSPPKDYRYPFMSDG
jgi:1-pyrroline-5-carboxylate dehydrogenase